MGDSVINTTPVPSLGHSHWYIFGGVAFHDRQITLTERASGSVHVSVHVSAPRSTDTSAHSFGRSGGIDGRELQQH